MPSALPITSHHGSWPNELRSGYFTPIDLRRRSRHRGPRRDAQRGIDLGVRGVERHPHHAVRHLGDDQRQGDGAPVRGDGDRLAGRGADLGRGGRGQPGHRRPCRARQVGLAVLKATGVEQHPPARQHRLARAGAIVLWDRHIRGRRPRCPASCRAGGVRRGRQRHRADRGRRPPPRRARRARGSRTWRWRQRGLERPRPTLPVDERARLLGDGCHREHDVRALGDGAVAQFQADDERRGVERRQRRGRIGQVVDLDAADEQGAQRAVRGGRQDARRVSPGGAG